MNYAFDSAMGPGGEDLSLDRNALGATMLAGHCAHSLLKILQPSSQMKPMDL